MIHATNNNLRYYYIY